MARPRDLTIRFERHILPHGGGVQREGLELFAELSCPVTSGHRALLDVIPCRRLDPSALDTLYGEFVRAHFTEMKNDADRKQSPHYGSRSLSLHWSSHACEIRDASDRPIAKGSEKPFFRLIAAVVSASAP